MCVHNYVCTYVHRSLKHMLSVHVCMRVRMYVTQHMPFIPEDLDKLCITRFQS